MVAMDGSVQPASKIEVFFAYSHRDEELRDELDRHLATLKREGVVASWHDREITAGREWKGVIDERLNHSGIILLLVSSDFLDSDYCYDVEMMRALERNQEGDARVVPIILRACDWHNGPLGELQALPTDGKPVTSWSNRDEAFADVARGIRESIIDLYQATQNSQVGDSSLTVESGQAYTQEHAPGVIAIAATAMGTPPKNI